MAIVWKFGKPDLFTTMTCNSEWPEITKKLLPGQTAAQRFDLCCRVFNVKLKVFIDMTTKRHILGKVWARVIVIEFQKRGLPQVHTLRILEDADKPRTPEGFDQIVCAELADPPDAELYEAVTKYMLHGPCGSLKPDAPSMKDGVCSKKYPRTFCETTVVSTDGYPQYRRRDDGRSYVGRRTRFDNRSVVPYNPYLCKLFNCHMNVEICSSVQSVKYLYKYVYKGHDRVQAEVATNNDPAPPARTEANRAEGRDEPNRYLDARYVSATEAFWRICEFRLQYIQPPVCTLQIRKEGEQSVTYRENSDSLRVLDQNEKTTLTEWMAYNRDHLNDHAALSTLCRDFPAKFTWNKATKEWTPRARGTSIGRTFYDAAVARGFLQTDGEFDNDLLIASGVSSPRQMRGLFAMMMMFCEMSAPAQLFEKHVRYMAEDFMHMLQVQEVASEIRDMVLADIDPILQESGSSISSFTMPVPTGANVLQLQPGVEDVMVLILEAEELSSQLNEDQRCVFDEVVDVIENGSAARDKCFFLDDPGGSGKTFLYKALISHVKASQKTCIVTASSGIAALLLPGGRTAHSAFKIPIPIEALSTCDIKVESSSADEIRNASLIIADEAPMLHSHACEAIDRNFRGIMRILDPSLSEVPFGGKTVLLGGNFRQMLPVIPRGSRGQVVGSCLNQSVLWSSFRRFRLTTNMRVGEGHSQWAERLLEIGEGRITDVPTPVGIRRVDSLGSMIQAVYGDFGMAMRAIATKAVITPLNSDVNLINDMVLSSFPGDVFKYSSIHTIPAGEVSNPSLYPVEFFNSVETPTLPLHKLHLKIGCIVLLPRNMNVAKGLCNGTRLRIDACYRTILRTTIVTEGPHFSITYMIPRIALYPSQMNLPFQFKRLQFPAQLTFAMTISKAQGQTLDTIGMYLPNELFAHGHLCVPLSRSRKDAEGIVYFNPNTEEVTITNVVFNEVFDTD